MNAKKGKAPVKPKPRKVPESDSALILTICLCVRVVSDLMTIAIDAADELIKIMAMDELKKGMKK